jgi:hypothetical protein
LLKSPPLTRNREGVQGEAGGAAWKADTQCVGEIMARAYLPEAQ